MESTINRKLEVQLTSAASAGKDLGLIINVFKTEYMTANCNPQPSVQDYGGLINHATDFKKLGSKMALNGAWHGVLFANWKKCGEVPN